MAPNPQKTGSFLALPLGLSVTARAADVFWGLCTAKADTNTFNKASQVVLERTDDKTRTTKDSYRDMFDQQVKKADIRAVFTEYAWDMNWCDPCAADPLSHEEPLSLGVLRLTETPPDFVPGRGPRPIMPPMGGGRDVFITRMNLLGDAQHLPEYEVLQETADLTGRQLTDMYPKMNLRTADAGNDGKWQQKLWTS